METVCYPEVPEAEVSAARSAAVRRRRRTDLLLVLGIADIGTSKGLLELYHIPADATTPYSSGNDYAGPGVGFGHVGFTVPDVAVALERVKGFGYQVLKPLHEAREEQMAIPQDAVDGKFGEVHEGYKHVFRQLAFVQDPDVSNLRMANLGRVP